MFQTTFEDPIGEEHEVAWEGLANLGLMVGVQLGILLPLGKHCMAFGALSLVAGAVAGIVKNQLDSGSAAIAAARLATMVHVRLHRHPRRKPPDSAAPVLVPVTILILENKLSSIDARLKKEDLNKRRRRWIMDAIDEKLAREGTPEFPAAA